MAAAAESPSENIVANRCYIFGKTGILSRIFGLMILFEKDLDIRSNAFFQCGRKAENGKIWAVAGMDGGC